MSVDSFYSPHSRMNTYHFSVYQQSTNLRLSISSKLGNRFFTGGPMSRSSLEQETNDEYDELWVDSFISVRPFIGFLIRWIYFDLIYLYWIPQSTCRYFTLKSTVYGIWCGCDVSDIIDSCSVTDMCVFVAMC